MEVFKHGAVLASNDFLPFGKEILANSARLSYIGKERDKESSLADHGVRKYDAEIGRFTSIEPLISEYYSHTPYHYCRNNPISRVDGNGLFDKPTHGELGYRASINIGLSEDDALRISEGCMDADGTLLHPGNAFKPAQHYQGSLTENELYATIKLESCNVKSLTEAVHDMAQDAYSHTNYIELALAYYGENNIPTIGNALNDKDFMKAQGSNFEIFTSSVIGMGINKISLGLINSDVHDKKNLDNEANAIKNYGEKKGKLLFRLAFKLALIDTENMLKEQQVNFYLTE